MFRGVHNNVPIGIVIYRDGVSEGEYSRVMEDEIGQVESTLTLDRQTTASFTISVPHA